MGFSLKRKHLFKPLIYTMAAVLCASGSSLEARADVAVHQRSNLGVIRGVVRDASGSAIADATIAIFRVGSAKLLKEVRSAADGSFAAKVLPGTYSVLAVAVGFNPASLASVQVAKSDDLVYGFKLERAGSGNTLPEKRVDRNNSKWSIRAAAMQRSIYQNTEGNSPVVAETSDNEKDAAETPRKGQTVVETYFADSAFGPYQGLNFATVLPKTGKAQVIIAGQTGTGNAPKRIEASLKFRANNKHQVRLNASAMNMGFVAAGQQRDLGQVSFQAVDEWSAREGVVIVFGLDYSKFIGAGGDSSVSPRLGLQLDIDPKTRFQAAYTGKTQERSWADAIEMEDTTVAFVEPAGVEDISVEQDKPRMNKSRRLEFGIERVLDNNSNVAASVFLDTTMGRGVGLASNPIDALSPESLNDFVANQTGRAEGVRVVYTRRLSDRFSTAAGYAAGRGQKLSENGITNPANLFQDDVFQTFFGQFEAALKTGTTVKTIFRFSPQATVFAIDPFQGRLAIYDPSLNVLVTQPLPNLGLPFHAEAIVDARNLFDFQAGVNGDGGGLRLTSQGRMLRGGVMVRF